MSASTQDAKTGNPRKWSVTQVCDFVRSIPGCAEYVEDFGLQEIDGVALMLLRPEILMSSMQIKLGPALKICRAVESMQEELKQNWRRANKKRVLFRLGKTLVGDVDIIQEEEEEQVQEQQQNVKEKKNEEEEEENSLLQELASEAGIAAKSFENDK